MFVYVCVCSLRIQWHLQLSDFQSENCYVTGKLPNGSWANTLRDFRIIRGRFRGKGCFINC